MQATKPVILEITYINERKSLSLGGNNCHKVCRGIHTWRQWQQRYFYTVKIMQIHAYKPSIFNIRNLMTGATLYLLGLLFYITGIETS